MPLRNFQSVHLRYGKGDALSCDVESEQVMAVRIAPPAVADLAESLTEAIRHPVEFPPLHKSVFPGDRVVLAVDPNLPAAETFIAGMCSEMTAASIRPEDILVLQPAEAWQHEPPDLRSGLSEEMQSRVDRRIHDVAADDACGYLASSAGGKRIYLARDLIEADVVITVGRMAFDTVLGYQGTSSVLYPGLSDAEAVQQAQGEGHRELGPDDERPLRSLIDEIGWLLGTQFTVQAIPGEQGGVSSVIAGLAEPVLRRGKQLLAEHWRLSVSSRCDVVVVTIDGRSPGEPWRKLGAAIEAGRNLVARGGKIVVLSHHRAELDAGMQMICEAREPSEALKPLRTMVPPDLVPARQLASATGWADIYLLSDLENELVEDLFMMPVNSHEEVQRLISRGKSCVFLESAHLMATRVGQ